MVKDTGSPPFIVDGNINIGGESAPVKGPDRMGAGGNRAVLKESRGRTGRVEAACMAC